MSHQLNVNNPLILKMVKSNTTPGTTYRLPSKGVPYKNGELADEVKDGEIVVYPMSILDEIYLKSPDMLFQGTAVEKVIARCCPQVLKPLEMLSKDIDYILTCMRQVSYGNLLTVPYKCDCEKSKEIQLEVPMSNFISRTKEFNNSVNQTFEIEGFLIKIQNVKFKDMIAINQENLMSGDNEEEMYESFINNITASIESIDEQTDRDIIKEFLRSQNRSFQMDIIKHVQELNNWGVQFDYKFKCKWCGQEKSTYISLNPVSFFSEPSRTEQATVSVD
jgi:hypothetical protein